MSMGLIFLGIYFIMGVITSCVYIIKERYKYGVRVKDIADFLVGILLWTLIIGVIIIKWCVENKNKVIFKKSKKKIKQSYNEYVAEEVRKDKAFIVTAVPIFGWFGSFAIFSFVFPIKYLFKKLKGG